MPRLDACGWQTPAGERAAERRQGGKRHRRAGSGRNGGGRNGYGHDGDLRLGVLAALLCWAVILAPILLFL